MSRNVEIKARVLEDEGDALPRDLLFRLDVPPDHLIASAYLDPLSRRTTS